MDELQDPRKGEVVTRGAEPVIEFADNVRIRAAPETEAAGVAGRTGQVYGFTAPSVTGVEGVIGGTAGDYAINVSFDDCDDTFWFHPRLLEFIDHGPATEIRLDGISKRWVRSASGEWIEFDDRTTEPARKPWWRLW